MMAPGESICFADRVLDLFIHSSSRSYYLYGEGLISWETPKNHRRLWISLTAAVA